ncbi:hypothetical protein P171DRAFT_485064 [Karstenula rhodostoma CBS 690.94]|uniref:TOM core complex subunit Tom6 n=1 Tax=Karstenula rhodostoma CBS 690.94 TaxID=1392251 RepID=A0A9P4PJ37_9PLEO|nr:hypothetical protein P171DRAFT_485064 [Karstenula rhodostoma CBS 690.94]
MAPKAVNGRKGEPNFAVGAYQTLLSKDNRSVVTAIGMFAIGVTFLHSSWAEMLLPA